MVASSRKYRKLGVAFGGGAARGFAHLGVIRVLEEAGVRPDFVAGTSVGSIIGALYAGGLTCDAIVGSVRALDWGDMVQPVFPRRGLVRADKLETRLIELLGERQVEDLETPFAAVTVDLAAGRQHVIDNGPLEKAVRASCSIPGIFEPVMRNDQVLVDGGVLNDVPIDVCQAMGAEVVLAVDLNSDIAIGDAPEDIFAVIVATLNVMMKNCRKEPEGGPDVILVRPDLGGFSYHDLKRIDEMIQRGEGATRKVMPRLLGRLRPRFLDI